jgi:ribosomal protein S18 acetylase RimI-like enzyme
MPPGEHETVSSPLGPLQIRPEAPEDEAFRYALFCESRPDLALLPLDAQGREQLMRMQFKAQAVGYRAQFPTARFDIVICDGKPVGRLVRAVAGGALHLVDIALAPAMRGHGIGTALLQALMDEARASALPIRLQVAANNDGAERLYRRLGFSQIRRDEAYVTMKWTPPSAGAST